MDLSTLQSEHATWVEHNFPDQRANKHWPLLGAAEEVGELSHAHLKFEQGIRGYDEKRYLKEAADALGDIVIYLASYCNANGFDLDECVVVAWNQVKMRDWKADPQKGGGE